jgi:hypothetical protein
VGRFEGRGISRRGDDRNSFAATQHKCIPRLPGQGIRRLEIQFPLSTGFLDSVYTEGRGMWDPETPGSCRGR